MTGNRDEAIRWMHAEKGYSVNEIARRLDLAPGSVSNALRRLFPQPKASPRYSDAGVALQHAPRLNQRAEPIHALDRSPCFNCGVRRDRHADFGCRKWRGGAA